MRLVLQALRTLLVASAFFFFWAGAVFFSWIVCPVLALVQRDEIRRRHQCQRICGRAFRIFHAYMRVLGLVRTEVLGAYSERLEGPFVMVSNHPTLVDVTALLAHYTGLCCVVKSSYVRNVFVGRWLRFCGHIDGGNGDTMSGAAVLQEAQKRLAEGDGVLIFPEGARSPKRGIRRFRPGAFELAARSRVPLWPVFVACDPPALTRGMPIWEHPDRAAHHQLVPQRPLLPEEGASSRATCRQVEATCREWLDARGFLNHAPRPLAESTGSSRRLPAVGFEWETNADDAG